jgi:hypothetical protein
MTVQHIVHEPQDFSATGSIRMIPVDGGRGRRAKRPDKGRRKKMARSPALFVILVELGAAFAYLPQVTIL